MSSLLLQLVSELGILLNNKNLRLVTVESCTGGGLAYWITSVPGSSDWFDRGFIPYNNLAKQEMINVSKKTLDRHSAVSEKTALELAKNALSKSEAQISIAITGIAGPSGGTLENPVGTVWIAWSSRLFESKAIRYSFLGDRAKVREQAIIMALKSLLDILRQV